MCPRERVTGKTFVGMSEQPRRHLILGSFRAQSASACHLSSGPSRGWLTAEIAGGQARRRRAMSATLACFDERVQICPIHQHSPQRLAGAFSVPRSQGRQLDHREKALQDVDTAVLTNWLNRPKATKAA